MKNKYFAFQIGHSFLFPFTKGKNRKIDDYNTRSKKNCLDRQNVVLKIRAVVVDIVNLCLEANNKNEGIHLKVVIAKFIDAITRLSKVYHRTSFARKEKSKMPYGKIIKLFVRNFDSKQLLGLLLNFIKSKFNCPALRRS